MASNRGKEEEEDGEKKKVGDRSKEGKMGGEMNKRTEKESKQMCVQRSMPVHNCFCKLQMCALTFMYLPYAG